MTSHVLLLHLNPLPQGKVDALAQTRIKRWGTCFFFGGGGSSLICIWMQNCSGRKSINWIFLMCWWCFTVQCLCYHMGFNTVQFKCSRSRLHVKSNTRMKKMHVYFRYLHFVWYQQFAILFIPIAFIVKPKTSILCYKVGIEWKVLQKVLPNILEICYKIEM